MKFPHKGWPALMLASTVVLGACAEELPNAPQLSPQTNLLSQCPAGVHLKKYADPGTFATFALSATVGQILVDNPFTTEAGPWTTVWQATDPAQGVGKLTVMELVPPNMQLDSIWTLTLVRVEDTCSFTEGVQTRHVGTDQVDLTVGFDQGAYVRVFNSPKPEPDPEPEPEPPPVVKSAAFLVLDEDAIDNGLHYYTADKTKRFFSTSNVNDDIARLAQRKQLRFFQQNVGATIFLVSGQVGDEGWFAPKVIPASWTAAGPTKDGIRNFVGNPTLAFPYAVGPGLGTGSNPESRLDKIPYVAPLRALGLERLIGQTVCAVVYDSDISINYGPLNGSLKGATLGVVAFEVLDVEQLFGFSSSTLPRVQIRIMDANTVCGWAQALVNDAPEPPSSSKPFDIKPFWAADDNGYLFVTR